MQDQDRVFDPYAEDSRYDAAIAVIGSKICALDSLRAGGAASSPVSRDALREIEILTSLRDELETRAVQHAVEAARIFNASERV